MSDLHGRLKALGDDGAEGMAPRLASEDRIQVLSGRVASGRRRRGVLGAAGTTAVVALLVAGAWAVLPGGAQAEWDPASPSPMSFEVRLDDYGDAPVVPAEVDTSMGFDRRLGCGQPFDLEPGVTIHDASAATRGARVTETLEPLVSDEADVDDNDDRLVWRGSWGGRDVLWTVTSLLVSDGVIVGTSTAGESGGVTGGYYSGMGDVLVPVGGTCSQGPVYSAYTVGTPVVVAQAYSDPFMSVDWDELGALTDEELVALGGEATLLATAVLDPRSPIDAPEPSATPSLVAPSDGVFQAFAVDTPERSCNALGDLRQGGEPAVGSTSTFLDLGDEVATLARLFGVQAPFADVPPDHWMVGEDAWLVFDTPEGARSRYLEWRTDGDGWEVLELGDAAVDPMLPPAASCVFPDAYEALGSAFLVVDAVAPNLAAYGAAWDEPTDGMQTWIHVGDA
ncbi:hypothetical protein [Demequina zhanjiangensis]|uniref:Uncharacterized protein n=1 Tax=Demequina zhanjiangensis TaxID=3051659 RepID=A0ABT8FYV0_9MICO|nr:hypothetical protein [Demequina sp. SYSU T00b26]MDN4472079.1 hypothetical protein [Demequina sp. SYSU T00b26]